LLAVVEGRSHAVDAHVGVGDELERGPFSGLDRVVGFDVAVDWREGSVSVGNDGTDEMDRVAGEGGISPSRTRKPTLDQSMVLTGGGGKGAMVPAWCPASETRG
jgi:hypothetical protein